MFQIAWASETPAPALTRRWRPSLEPPYWRAGPDAPSRSWPSAPISTPGRGRPTTAPPSAWRHLAVLLGEVTTGKDEEPGAGLLFARLRPSVRPSISAPPPAPVRASPGAGRLVRLGAGPSLRERAVAAGRPLPADGPPRPAVLGFAPADLELCGPPPSPGFFARTQRLPRPRQRPAA